MKIRAAILLCLAALTLNAPADSLRDQLKLAEDNHDTYAEIELTRRILDQEPADAALQESLADLWLKVDDYDMAEKAITAWKDAPPAVRARVLATVQAERGDTAGAIKILEEYLTKNPEDQDRTRQLVGYLTATGQNEKLIALLDTAPGVSRDISLLVTRAIARRNMHDFEGALRDFALAEGMRSWEAPVENNRPAFERLRSAWDGIRSSSARLKDKPDDQTALLSRVYWYLFTGVAGDLALVDAEQAHKAAPASVTAKLLYAQAANSAGKLTAQKALQDFSVDTAKPLPSLQTLDHILDQDNLLAANPKDAKALADRAALLNGEPQQYALARDDAAAALEIDPANTEARVEKVRALVQLKSYEAAATEYLALENSKAPPARVAIAASNLVDAAFTASQFQEALKYATYAIKLQPTAIYYKQRAAILQRLERPVEAKADLAKADELAKKKSSR